MGIDWTQWSQVYGELRTEHGVGNCSEMGMKEMKWGQYGWNTLPWTGQQWRSVGLVVEACRPLF